MSKKKLSKLLVWIGLFFMALALTLFLGAYLDSINHPTTIDNLKGLATAAVVFGSFAATSICAGIVCKLLACKECGSKTSIPA